MDYGFDISDLTGATVAEELSPLQFDREDYTPFEEFLHRIAMLPEKPKKVHNYALGVNGRVVNDRMEKYSHTRGKVRRFLKRL